MRLTHKIINREVPKLEIHIEPWCEPYYLECGSEIVFHFEVKSTSEAYLTTEYRAADWVALWSDAVNPPSAELDGKAVKPMWG